jgi:hypothetical protein
MNKCLHSGWWTIKLHLRTSLEQQRSVTKEHTARKYCKGFVVKYSDDKI